VINTVFFKNGGRKRKENAVPVKTKKFRQKIERNETSGEYSKNLNLT
jgi:hypothetical protein